MAWEGRLTPSEISATYLVRIELEGGVVPHVRVLDPALSRRRSDEPIPHMYNQERLCLFVPHANEWTGEHSIVDIVAWTCEWLMHYEAWHVTGEWLGGGLHPDPTGGAR